MREQERERCVSIEDAGEIHSRHGDSCFEREAEGEWEDVAGSRDGGVPTECGGGEAVVWVQEY